MSLLVETVRIENGIPQNVGFHNERILRSLYGIYGLKIAPDLNNIIKVPEFAITGIFKCRVLYDNKTTRVEFLPYKIRTVRSLKIVTAENICYPYKYEEREKINVLFAMRGDCDDILIIKNGMVTDSSYSNVVFLDMNGNWVTPSTYLLQGTRRTNLLKNKIISEANITSADIKKYTEVRLINAMIGLDDTEGIPVTDIF